MRSLLTYSIYPPNIPLYKYNTYSICPYSYKILEDLVREGGLGDDGDDI